jgi:uncharacterized protein (DUF58 family)
MARAPRDPRPPGTRGKLREALRGLTVRGRCFLSAGLACLLASFLVGQAEIIRLGTFLAALPLLAAIVVSRTRYRLSCRRALIPGRLPVGHAARVQVRLENVSRLPTGVLLVEDNLTYSLGPRPRFLLDRIESGGTREVAYTVRSDVRGKFTVGPLAVRLTDPFGLCELTRSFTTVDELVVTPVVSPLPTTGLGGEWAGGGESQARQVASAGEDDASTREYRFGDDLRKVHWKSTARVGELMVRREEQPWQSRATLLIDNRARAHRGDGPGSSFEWAVSAAASAGVHLSRAGYTLRFLTTEGGDVQAPGAGAGEGLLLDTLAVIQGSKTGEITTVTHRLHRGGEGLVVAVLGELTSDEALAVGRLRQRAAACIAILIDTAGWVSSNARSRAESEAALDANAAVLRQAGWRVIVARHGNTLASLWPQAALRRVPIGGRR